MPVLRLSYIYKIYTFMYIKKINVNIAAQYGWNFDNKFIHVRTSACPTFFISYKRIYIFIHKINLMGKLQRNFMDRIPIINTYMCTNVRLTVVTYKKIYIFICKINLI